VRIALNLKQKLYKANRIVLTFSEYSLRDDYNITIFQQVTVMKVFVVLAVAVLSGKSQDFQVKANGSRNEN